MLGYVTTEGRGAADRLLVGVAMRLRAEGMSLAGAVQHNVERDPRTRCDMDLRILSGRAVIRISQDLGRGARGCRLDPEGLERAAGLVAAALEGPVDVLIVNKFGKQELDGRGFRPLIGQALASGIPVLTAVNRGNLPGFHEFAAGMAEEIPANPEAVAVWCREVAGN